MYVFQMNIASEYHEAVLIALSVYDSLRLRKVEAYNDILHTHLSSSALCFQGQFSSAA